MKVLVIVAVNICSLPCSVQQSQGPLGMLGTPYQDSHNVMLHTTVGVYCVAAKAMRCCLFVLASLAGGKMNQWEVAARLECCLPVTFRNNPSPQSQINRILGVVIVPSTLVRNIVLPWRTSLIFTSTFIHTADFDGWAVPQDAAINKWQHVTDFTCTTFRPAAHRNVFSAMSLGGQTGLCILS